MLTDVKVTLRENRPVLSFKFNPVAAPYLTDASHKNYHNPVAIVLDNKVISAPIIRESILSGGGVILASLTMQSAYDLALLLRTGALPAPITVLEERAISVRPSHGTESR